MLTLDGRRSGHGGRLPVMPLQGVSRFFRPSMLVCHPVAVQAQKQTQLQLFRLFHNEHDIEEVSEELSKMAGLTEKEVRRRDRMEEDIRERKREQGRVARELTKVEQQIKESVSNVNLSLTV